MTYPTKWPKFSAKRPTSIASRVTEAQKHALYGRTLTTRELATALKVNENYLSRLFPGKGESKFAVAAEKRILATTRREFRVMQAHRVLKKEIKATEASAICNVHYRNMLRYVVIAKEQRAAKNTLEIAATTPVAPIAPIASALEQEIQNELVSAGITHTQEEEAQDD